jgi:hypothetical protein
LVGDLQGVIEQVQRFSRLLLLLLLPELPRSSARPARKSVVSFSARLGGGATGDAGIRGVDDEARAVTGSVSSPREPFTNTKAMRKTPARMERR